MKPDWSTFGIGYDISCKMDSSELGHVLELFDFPPSFVEADLSNVFKDFKKNGFSIQ
jgi:hypothetical protein